MRLRSRWRSVELPMGLATSRRRSMPVKSVFKTEISHVSILDEHGKFDAKLGKGLIPDKDLVALYQHMLACRQLDEVAFKLQRSGRMGTYPENRGQEATS